MPLLDFVLIFNCNSNTGISHHRALEKGEIDAIAGMFYSRKRDEKVTFSPPYTVIHHSIFVRKNESTIEHETDLKDKEIIVMRSDIMHDYVLEKV